MPSERGSLPPESARVPVDIRRFPWIRKLAADYAFDFPRLSRFFSGDPSQPASWKAAIDRTRARAYPRAELAQLIAAEQARRGAPDAARKAAALLTNPESVAVVTGQQAGLFGGPAFCLYKAITALKLADRISRDHGVPAVAIFWVEAEDHDWDEVSSCAVLDQDFHRRSVQLPAPANAGEAPIASITLDAHVEQAIHDLAAMLPPTEFTPGLIDAIRRAYAPGVGMADAFARLLESWLGDRGLVVYDCSARGAKPLAADIFSREVEHAGRTWQLAGDAGDDLIRSGYHAQVAKDHDGAALFHLDGKRAPVDVSDRAKVVAEIRRNPGAFSPNVLLRPVVQDSLFPTVCYVAGPNELAYLGQLRKVYDAFDVPMPLFFPRASVTVLDSASAKFLAKHGLALDELHARDEALLNRLLAATLPPALEQALHGADTSIAASLAKIIDTVPALDPTLEGAAKSTLGKMQHELTTLRGKIISAAKKKDETLRRQFTRAQAQAFPDGDPQERALSGLSLLNRHGPALIDRVYDLPADLGHHWVLTV